MFSVPFTLGSNSLDIDLRPGLIEFDCKLYVGCVDVVDICTAFRREMCSIPNTVINV